MPLHERPTMNVLYKTIRALIECYIHGEDQRFFSLVMHVAAWAARNDDPSLAKDLKNLVDEGKSKIAARREREKEAIKDQVEQERVKQRPIWAQYDAYQMIFDLDYALGSVFKELDYSGMGEDIKTAWTEVLEIAARTCTSTVTAAYDALDHGLLEEASKTAIAAQCLAETLTKTITTGPFDLPDLLGRVNVIADAATKASDRLMGLVDSPDEG